MIPTHLQIMGELTRDKWGSDLALVEGSNMRADAKETHHGRTDEDNTIQELLNQWESGAHSYVPYTKNDNIIRLACKNTNRLSLFHRKAHKTRKLANLNNRYQTDGMCVVQHGVNFGHEEARGEKQAGGVFATFIGSRTLAGYNTHKKNPLHGRRYNGCNLFSTIKFCH
jgi:hypothetical protein